MFKFARNQKGFSLVELIVVIVILGILVAIAVPALIGYIAKANVAADIAAADGLRNAATAYCYTNKPNDPVTATNLETYLKDATLNDGVAPYNDASWPKAKRVTGTGDGSMSVEQKAGTDGNLKIFVYAGDGTTIILPVDEAAAQANNPYASAPGVQTSV